MVHALTRGRLGHAHPVADRETTAALIVEQNRAVVALTGRLADAAVVAAHTDRSLQLLTPESSALTYPLEMLLHDGDGTWVVRDSCGFRDGLTGSGLRWSGERFEHDSGASSVVVPDPGTGSVEVQIVTVHGPVPGLLLGGTAELAARALTGHELSGWGVAEPVTQPWSRRELTAPCLRRAPQPTALVLVGSGVIGTLDTHRVEAGVRERVRLAGPAATAVGRKAVEDLAGAVAGSARTMVVGVHVGRSDGLRTSRPVPPAVPYGVLIGGCVVANRGPDHARHAPASTVRMLGSACWCVLGGGAAPPFEQLTAVLRHFGATAG